MGEPARAIEQTADEQQQELDQRVDGLLEAHAGDWRAVVETLLTAYDQMDSAASHGFVRQRFWKE